MASINHFSDRGFKSYVCFLYAAYVNPLDNGWFIFIKVFAVEELFYFPYPFQLPKSFLVSRLKNNLRLKIRLMKSLAFRDKEKIFDSEEFFNPINVRNDDLIKIERNIIQLSLA